MHCRIGDCQADRCHAYRHLARLWGGHRRVMLAFLTIDLVWLLPWSGLALRVSGLCYLDPFTPGPLAVLAVLRRVRTQGTPRAAA
jgi:hypothetical protein